MPALRQSLHHRLAALARLDLSDCYHLLSSFLLLPLMARTLKRHGLKAAWSGLKLPDKPALPPPTTQQIAQAYRVARMVDVAANHGPGQPSCLARSLVLMKMLNKRGIDCTLEIGGMLPDASPELFKAHAWVRCGSYVINDEEHIITTYQPFPLPASWPQR